MRIFLFIDVNANMFILSCRRLNETPYSALLYSILKNIFVHMYIVYPYQLEGNFEYISGWVDLYKLADNTCGKMF